MNPPRRWLCIACAFPPINRSGTRRTLGFVRHLHAMNWHATVLAAEPCNQPLDPALLAHVPSSTRILRVPCVNRVLACKRRLGLIPDAEASKRRNVETPNTPRPAQPARHDLDFPSPTNLHHKTLRDWFTRLLLLPDSCSGWIRPALRTARAALRIHPTDILYSTSPCASAHLIALRLKRSAGLPWVADFRDPWRDNAFRRMPYRSLDWLDARMERAVLRHADRIVWNTEAARAQCRARYPRYASKCSVIPNGFDAESFEDLVPLREVPTDLFLLAHAGQFYGPRSPIPLFRALRAAVERRPELASTLQLHLVGPDHYDGTPLAQLARSEGVHALVHVYGPRPHHETLRRLAAADALLLAASHGAGADRHVPAKLFEYLALRRPILALLPDNHPALGILNEARAPALVAPPDDVPTLARALDAAATRRFPTHDRPWSGVPRFDRAHRARELAAIFDILSGTRSVLAFADAARMPGRHLHGNGEAHLDRPAPFVSSTPF